MPFPLYVIHVCARTHTDIILLHITHIYIIHPYALYYVQYLQHGRRWFAVKFFDLFRLYLTNCFRVFCTIRTEIGQ